jgi:hypothetical protein
MRDERGDFGGGNGFAKQDVDRAQAIPGHPGELLPSPFSTWDAAKVALHDLECLRGMETGNSGYAAACHKAVWEAAYGAAADVACHLVREAHPNSPWAEDKPAPKVPTLHVIHSGPGSGKSTAAKAFMVGLARVTESHKFPIGCALLVHHIETAAKAFAELSALLPKRVAVFSSEHDANSPVAIRQPRFTVEELEEYPVIVVTHEFYRGVRGDRARSFQRNGLTLPRVVTFVDEKVNEVETYDLVSWRLDRLITYVQADEQAPDELRQGLRLVEDFVRGRKQGERNLENPANDREAWSVADKLGWFATEDASRYARTHMASLRNKRRGKAAPKDIEMVFGFARCMVNEQAFIKRYNQGKQGATFVGCERTFPQYPGMLLLDATADIDGVSELCPWRKHQSTPPERYDNLEIVQVPSIAEGTLSEWLDHPPNTSRYAHHILDTVVKHVGTDQKALIVCKQDVVQARPPIAGWSEHMEHFTTKKPTGPAADGEQREGFPWVYQGRSLGLTWWGGYGIGANDWQEADVVLLFDLFHLPGHTMAAITQGLKSAKATEPPLSVMMDTRSPVDDVKKIKVGHLLRWTRQMALRGKSRRFDDTGRCGAQKLVLVGDGLFLVEHGARLFPGAKITYADTEGGKLLYRLITALRTTELPKTIKAVHVADLLGVVWKNVCTKLIRHDRFEPLLASIGWQYVHGRGKAGSRFVRVVGHAEARSVAGNVPVKDHVQDHRLAEARGRVLRSLRHLVGRVPSTLKRSFS